MSMYAPRTIIGILMLKLSEMVNLVLANEDTSSWRQFFENYIGLVLCRTQIGLLPQVVFIFKSTGVGVSM